MKRPRRLSLFCTVMIVLTIAVSSCAVDTKDQAKDGGAPIPQIADNRATSTMAPPAAGVVVVTIPETLAFTERFAITESLRTTTTASASIPLGGAGVPFATLPEAHHARAVMSPSGVVMPVIKERATAWLVGTVCESTRLISDATPIGRAHVVLDPGHGGREVGAVGPNGLRESDLNLAVATLAAELLEQAGATVVLTRTGDYTVTAASRGRIAKAIEPALFVSIHHNGGAPPTSDRPGTLVFSKTDSPESSRFGGLFYERMQPMLSAAAEPKQEAYRLYAEALDAYEATIDAYDASVVARDAALILNGQLPPEATTTVPKTTTVAPGEIRVPRQRALPTTTTRPVTAVQPVAVPEALPLPTPLEMEPVREFRWAGAGNAGVRSWTRQDGLDYLGVLRHSGAVPAALAEFLFVTNPSEEELLADQTFIARQATVLAEAITVYFGSNESGSGFVNDQYGEQPIGGGGSASSCVEPELGG